MIGYNDCEKVMISKNDCDEMECSANNISDVLNSDVNYKEEVVEMPVIDKKIEDGMISEEDDCINVSLKLPKYRISMF